MSLHACAPYLSSVGEEQGRGEVSRDTTEDIDDGDPHPTSQLLQVSHDGHLEYDRHQTVQQPTPPPPVKRINHLQCL